MTAQPPRTPRRSTRENPGESFVHHLARKVTGTPAWRSWRLGGQRLSCHATVEAVCRRRPRCYAVPMPTESGLPSRAGSDVRAAGPRDHETLKALLRERNQWPERVSGIDRTIVERFQRRAAVLVLD